MFKIFARMWRTNWASQWQYRANLIMYVFYGLVSPVVFLSVWRAVAASQGQVSGLTVNDFTIYYLALMIVDMLTGEISIWVLAWKVQDGTLSGELLLPVHPVLTNNLMNNLANKALTLVALLPVWTVLYLVFRPDFSSITLASFLLTIPAVIIGFFINFLLGAVVTCAAFWTTRVYSLNEFLFGFHLLLGGIFVPLTLLPPVAQQVAFALPFQLFRYFPVQLLLGRLTPEQVAWNFGMAVFWLAVMAAAFRWVWNAGLKRYSAVGA